MREEAFRGWLAARNIDAGTLSTRMSYLRRLVAHYGDLDAAWAADGFRGLTADLSYSTEDRRAGRPNPSRLDISGDLYNNLSSYRSHLNSYRQFVDGAAAGEPAAAAAEVEPPLPPSDDSPGPSLSLERDLERALRASPGQIEPGLSITDGGVQAIVPSGRIDILAEDAAGRQVVIELKAVRAPRDAVAQVLAYMGDLQAETGRAVRGVLIAPDFDSRAISAARMVPALVLRRFSFQFSFETVDPAP